jgi:hypothetical protein
MTDLEGCKNYFPKALILLSYAEMLDARTLTHIGMCGRFNAQNNPVCIVDAGLGAASLVDHIGG